MITLRWLEDECLCPIALLKEVLARTVDKEPRTEKLSVTRKMGLLTAILNATIASWLKETLPMPTIECQALQLGKSPHPMLSAREPQSG